MPVFCLSVLDLAAFIEMKRISRLKVAVRAKVAGSPTDSHLE